MCINYSREQINELKSNIDYLDFYQRFLPDLVQKGNRGLVCCCFHNDKHPSLSLDFKYGLYKCWSCSESGDVFSFYQKFFNVSFNEAVEKIAEMYNFKLKISEEENEKRKYIKSLYNINNVVCNKFEINLQNNIKALDYLHNRGFNDNVIQKFRLGCGINNLPDKESLKILGLKKENEDGIWEAKFKNYRITIPRIDENGNILSFTGRDYLGVAPNCKYLHTQDTEIYKKSNLVFGLYQAKKSIKALDSVICVEGELDCIKCHQHGITNAISISGLNMSDTQINLLKRFTSKFYICVEDQAILRKDSHNQSKLDKLYKLIKEKIPYAKIYVIDLRENENEKCDPDMYLNTHTKEDFIKLIQQAKIYNEFIINSKLKEFNPRNIEEKTACINIIAPLLYNISSFIDRKQYVELVANKLMVPENNIYTAIKRYTTKQDQLQSANITWDSRPVYAQKILLSMCFNPNFDTINVITKIKILATDYMEPLYKNIFNNYIYEYIKKYRNEKNKDIIDFNDLFSELEYNKDSSKIISDIIRECYLKTDIFEDLDNDDVNELIEEQIDTLKEYVIDTSNQTENELESIDI